MAGIENESRIMINPALERAQRVERALGHVVKLVELELADIALSEHAIDESTHHELRELGAVFLRLSSLGLTAANSVSQSVNERQVYTPTPQRPTPTVAAPHVVLPPEVSRAPLMTPAVPEAEIIDVPTSTVEEPPLVDVPQQETPIVRTESRLLGVARGEQPQRKQREKQQPQYENELYQKVITEAQIPTIEQREGMNPIDIQVTADDVLSIGNTEVELIGDRLFIFNALMMLRSGLIPARKIREFGFRPDSVSEAASSQAFSKAINSLIDELRETAGLEIIKKVGQGVGTKYAVNPTVVLHDKRDAEPSLIDDTEIVKKKKSYRQLLAIQRTPTPCRMLGLS